jgi:hypothetical protein
MNHGESIENQSVNSGGSKTSSDINNTMMVISVGRNSEEKSDTVLPLVT